MKVLSFITAIITLCIISSSLLVPQSLAQAKKPLSPNPTTTPLISQPIESSFTAATVSATPAAPVQDLTSPDASSSLTTLLDQNPTGPLSWNNFISYAIRVMVLHNVPINTVILILMLPLVAALAAFSRQVIGFKSFGIYTPTVIAVAFLATGLRAGLGLFILIVLTTTLARYVLRYLHILYLPRTALILVFVSILMFAVLFLSAFFDVGRIKSISIFPILILITLAENFINIQMDKNLRQAAIITTETLLLAVVGFLVMQWPYLQQVVLLHPEITLLSVILFIILTGRWTGLRLVEYLRFREVLKYGKD